MKARQIGKVMRLLFCGALILLCGSSCSKSAPDTIEEISAVIEENANFTNMSTLSDAQLANYFSYTEQGVARAKMVISNSETVADEYVVFELEEGAGGETIVTELSDHVATRQRAFRETSQTEYAKLQNSIIRRLGRFRILVVTENYVQVAQALEKCGAERIH